MKTTLAGLAAACGLLALSDAAAAQTTQATLLDRVQIEDLLIAYYQPLGGSHEDFAAFYAPDCVLDINGRVYKGKAGIAQAYKDARAAQGPGFKGKFHMLMTNPRIVVRGRTATADAIWTGVSSATPKSTPAFVEQGHEHDELVKVGGRWLIKHRLVTSDGGLPDYYAATYKDR
jgi:hypothetical protein